MGDAEALPFADDSFDRYVSCGSIEYWPDPGRAIAEAHRVVRPGGTVLVVGPLSPRRRLARLVADVWMLFPTEAQYRSWFESAGFEEIEELRLAPPWGRGSGEAAYAIAIAGRANEAGAASDVRARHRGRKRAMDGAAVAPLRRRLTGGCRLRAGRARPAPTHPTHRQGLMPCGMWRHGPGSTSRIRGSPPPITLWRFSRPHTLVGTTVSILGIYAIAAAELPGVALGDGIGDLALTLLAGAAVNIYIVGLNQCEDVEIDRINKPWLPIPAGRLSLRAAWRLVIASGVLAVGLAAFAGLGRGRGRGRGARHRHGLLAPRLCASSASPLQRPRASPSYEPAW